MASADSIKDQRDRFLAFAFASADLFMEISHNGNIIFAFGAAKGLTGVDDKSLVGKNWLELFAVEEQAKIADLKDNAKVGLRIGPIIINLNDKLSNKKGIVTGIKMPESECFYLTLSISSVLMEQAVEASATDPEAITTDFDPSKEEPETITTGFDPNALEEVEVLTTGFKASDNNKKASTPIMQNKEEFFDEAEQTFDEIKEQNIKSALTVFDLNKSETMPEESWNEMIGEISDFLQAESVGGSAAAELTNDKYSIVHDANKDAKELAEKISAIAKEHSAEGEEIALSSKTLDADIGTMSSNEAARALFYTLSEFEKSGTELSIESLSAGIKTFVSDNDEKIQEFKRMIDQVDFDIHFQPIVNLNTLEATHYEALSRFKTGNTQEWVMFGEDVGMAADFDLAVVERVMNFIHYKAGVTRTKFSINLSGRSIENPEFFEKLKEKLETRDFANRILFEITESTKIEDLDKVSVFVEELQEAGYEIALDDFGAGAASFEYLQKLKIDYVKIDGKYIRRILKSSRDEVMIRNLVKMCKDLKTKVIAEFVESQEQADLLKEMGVDYGQGYLYGKAESKPSYVPKA